MQAKELIDTFLEVTKIKIRGGKKIRVKVRKMKPAEKARRSRSAKRASKKRRISPSKRKMAARKALKTKKRFGI